MSPKVKCMISHGSLILKLVSEEHPLNTHYLVGPYTPPYMIVQFLLFLVNLLNCRISNLMILENKRRFESRPPRSPYNTF